MVVAALPTPTIPNGRWSAFSECQIKAPAAIIYNAIIDTSTWPEWSTFVPKVDIKSQPAGHDADSPVMVDGTQMSFTVHMSPSTHTSSGEMATSISPAPKPGDAPGTKYTAGWIGQTGIGPLLRAERVNEIITTEDPDVCEYRSWETFTGPVSLIVKYMFGQHLDDRFDDWAKELKDYCEEKAGEVKA